MKSEKRDSKENSSGMDGDTTGSSKFCDFGDDDDFDRCGELPSDGEHSPIDSLPNSPPNSPPKSPAQNFNHDKEKRRRSTTWQAKLDRRRRKTSSNPDEADEVAEPPVNYHRQKRHSWWNILVPDNIKHR